jgi:hypothetical protein
MKPLAALHASPDETGLLEHVEMLGHGLPADREDRGQRRHRECPLAVKASEDQAPGGIGYCCEYV